MIDLSQLTEEQLNELELQIQKHRAYWGEKDNPKPMDEVVDEVAEPFMNNCIIRGNPPNGCSSWSEWFELFGSKGILHNLNISAKEYQPTEPPKPKHLQQIIQECFDDKMNIHTIPDIIDRIEKEWTPLNLNQKENRGFTDGYSMGFDDALNLVRKTLR